jgi:hypothetical protein
VALPVYEISPGDPRVLSMTVALLAIVAMFASLGIVRCEA